jgi:arsenite methyltransferase
MNTELELKATVKERYGEIAARPVQENRSSCCGATNCCSDETTILMADDYSALGGYNPDADLGLGCGLPTEFAKIKRGDTVVDLGSGAGNDCFVARSIVGEEGKVIGIDFTEKMIELARRNTEKTGYKNVQFRLGDIDDMPLVSNTADVVVSNCVLNLVPNKHRAFSEIFRILKPGGHFSISDIVLEEEIPPSLKKAAEMYAGCVAGAIMKVDYLEIIREAGFTGTLVQKEKAIILPDEILADYLSESEIQIFKKHNGIRSITVYAQKPAKDERNCCEPGNGCC